MIRTGLQLWTALAPAERRAVRWAVRTRNWLYGLIGLAVGWSLTQWVTDLSGGPQLPPGTGLGG